MEWEVDLSQHRGMKNWFGKQPKLMQIACAQMLNQFAFGTRAAAIRRINELMTVRNPRFVASRLQYTKANRARKINDQVAWTGSRALPRFSGWTEQEFGKRPMVNRTATLVGGRGGSEQRQVRHVVRLKKGKKIVTRQTYRMGDKPVGQFLRAALRKKENAPIIVKSGKGLTLYKRKGNKLEAAQIFSRKQPKRQRWMKESRAAYFRQTDLGLLWEQTCNRLVTPPRPAR